MRQFQQLLRAALLAGATAGAAHFVYQYFVVIPRILAAETFEAHNHHEHHHHTEEWKPADGLERNYYTAASTVLTGIGYAALLISISTLTGLPLTTRNGLLWGLAGFLTFSLAPALGNPPEPPGVPAADLHARQLWWLITVAATASGLLLTTKKRYAIAALLLVLPHLLGAPQTNEPSPVPVQLVHQFTLAALAGSALFWFLLGPLAGCFAPAPNPN